METKKTTAAEVDTYIAAFPPEVQAILQQIRTLIQETAPEAEETFQYQMPAYRLRGPLVYFGGFPNHIGFYPTPSGITAFKDELSPYKSAKGSVQFPLDKPMPYDLIRRIVEFRVQENLAKAKGKKKG